MKLWVRLALVACLLLFSTAAAAQMSEGEKKAAARAAYTEGVDLQEKGKPADALSRFEAAQKLYDAPTHLIRIAECQALTGKLVEASETYETLIRKTLPPGSPEAFVHAQEQGKTALSALRPRIPTMKVVVKPDPQTLQNLQIYVNDKPMPPELIGLARPVNPGAYKLNATATGWGTPAPSTVEMNEKETKVVDLTLQQGANGGGGVVVAPLPDGSTAPPPYEQPKPKLNQSPSPMGLLVGARVGVFVPGGDVDNQTSFDKFAVAGPGFGIDGMLRIVKLLLLGATFEYASLGAPDASAFQQGTTAEVATRTFYLGVLAGIMPNVDKVTFVADANLGYRTLSRDLTVTDTTTGARGPESSATYSGVELGINAGLSIPVGPIRIVPKAGLAFGSFSDRSCNDVGTGTTTFTGCNSASSLTSSSHTIFNVVLGLYYHFDFAKRSGAAVRAPPLFLNAAR